MKRFLLFTGLLLFCHLAKCQPVTESHRIFSDRGIYITGEEIRFTVFSALQTGSTVFYTELISPGGITFSRSKILLDPLWGEGKLLIPEDLPSGTYYLKGYTRWLRNFGPAVFSYLSLEVVNPRQPGVLPVDTKAGPISFRSMDDMRDSAIDLGANSVEDRNGSIICELSPVLEKGSVVKADISVPAGNLDGCVSLVHRGGMGEQKHSVDDPDKELQYSGSFMPEIRGPAISGEVLQTENSLPAPFAMVYVTLLGERREFICNHADSSGYFHVALPPERGEAELFISSYHPSYGELSMQIGNDFCARAVNLPSLPLKMEGTRENLIRTLAVNAQVREQWAEDEARKDKVSGHQKSYFYGQPTSIVRFADFIRLPTMEEYFTEVMPQVSLKKRRGESRLAVQGPHPDMTFYEPLLMVDGVAIFDIDAVLDINPRYVDRIEIIEAPYVRGTLTFGGVINLISKNGDMAFIDLPSSGLLVNFMLIQEEDESKLLPPAPREPDIRSSFHWDPSLRVEEGKPHSLEFIAPSNPGSYELVIRGLDDQGNYHSYTVPFEVR